MKDIINENKKYVRAVIRKLTGSSNEDIEQEVYIKTWQKLPKYKEQGKFRQWLCTLTANLCRDYFRSGSYRARQKENGEIVISEIAAPFETPEEKLDRKTRQKIILKAVDDLPRIYREVIVLFEFEEYSLDEIAKRLKIPSGTVKSRLSNARKILSKELSFLKGEDQ